MSEPAQHRVTSNAPGTALLAAVISLEDAAGEHRVIVMDLLAGHR
jgi:hypothetical protein